APGDESGSGGDLESLTPPALRELPTMATQPQNSQQTVYQAAKANLQRLWHLLDRGKGLDKAIGATVPDESPHQAALRYREGQSQGPEILIAPLKGESRAAEKVTEKLGGDWSQLQDVVRAT